MSNLILDSLTIYGLENIPATFNVDNKEISPKTRPATQIVDVNGLGLSMSKSYTITWAGSGTSVIEPPPAVLTEPKYRVDCYPEPGKRHF